MKSDLEYCYMSECEQFIKVIANIEGVEVHFREANENVVNRILLIGEDAQELAQMVTKAAEHHKDLNKGKL